MEQLPPELEPRRDALFARVRTRGRALRRRRMAALSTAMALVVLVPVATFAIVRADDDPDQVAVNDSVPDTTTTTSAASTSTTPPTTSPAPPTTGTTVPTFPLRPVSTTTALVCRNSTNPACGPMYYDPPMTNEPATITVSTSPPVPRAGDMVTFTVHVTDPDSFFFPGPPMDSPPCGDSIPAFGDGENGMCVTPGCRGPGPQYGAWDPPPRTPSDVTYVVQHIYKAAGNFMAHFSVGADQCGPRRSVASMSVPMEIAP
jgi:hypothetical protein